MTTEYTTNFGLAKPDFRMGPWHDLLNANADALDTILFGVLSDANVGLWENNTPYTQGTSALDGQDATTWMCVIDHTSSATGVFADERAAHPTYWTQLLAGFAPRGQWTNNTNYFPYDLVYDGNLGIMALCEVHHTSNTSGNIKDDEAFWSFLIDMSNAALATAIAVSYSNVSSAIPKTNVQDAIDYLQTEVVALNNVNINQGADINTNTVSIGNHTTQITGLTTRMGTAETTNNSQDTSLASHNTRITAIENTLAAGAFFAPGTKMVFYQAAAPIGWTKVTTDNDKALRVVSGTTGGTAGGTNPFSSVMAQTTVGNHALTLAEIPSHSHAIPSGLVQTLVYNYYNAGSQGNVPTSGNTSAAGGGGVHNHPITMQMQYIDVIVASKN